MTNGEAVNWLNNLIDDIGAPQHSSLWDYEQALSEIRELIRTGSRWVSRNKKLPEDQQKCLLILLMGGGKYVDVGTFSTDLYSVDKYAFADKKGVAGWYYRDSEYGFCEHYGVTAWMPLPDPPEGDTE